MRVEVLGGLERRRRWSQDDKVRIVEETLAPGAKVTEVARRNGVAASVVFTWRRQARTVEQVGRRFAPVQIAAAEALRKLRSFCLRMTGGCGPWQPRQAELILAELSAMDREQKITLGEMQGVWPYPAHRLLRRL